jgi:hypothetical protein
MTEIHAQFTYTSEEYAEAQRVYYQRMAPRGRRFFVRALIIVGILLLAVGVFLVVSHGDVVWTIFCLAYGGFVVMYYGPLGAWRFKRDFLRAKTLQGEKTAVVGEERVYISGAFGESKTNWTAFGRYAETPNLFVLFIPPRLFYMLPKRAFSEADQAAIRQLLEQKIGSGKAQEAKR